MICVILQHLHELADAPLQRFPVHRLRDMRMFAPDADRKFLVFDVAD